MNKTCKFSLNLFVLKQNIVLLSKEALQASSCIVVSANPNAFK
jgi:hypothetical protein